jgi:NO-binding membrane sensor protein with MHYT domain
MDFRPGELVAVRAGSHWPELVGRIQMIHAQGIPIWLAVLDVDTGDVLGVPTTHVIGKLEYADPAPSGWGSFTPIESIQKAGRPLRKLDGQVRKRNS